MATSHWYGRLASARLYLLFDEPFLQLALQSNSSIAPSAPEGNGAPPSPAGSTTTSSTSASASATGDRPNSAVPQSRHRLGPSLLVFLILGALNAVI